MNNLLLAACLALFLAGCNSESPDIPITEIEQNVGDPNNPVNNAHPSVLVPSASDAELIAYFRDNLKSRSKLAARAETVFLEEGPDAPPQMANSAIEESAVAPPPAVNADESNAGDVGGAADDVSGTNLVVAGVDEQDRAKTDGVYLYVVNQHQNHNFAKSVGPTMDLRAFPSSGLVAPDQKQEQQADISVYRISEVGPQNILVSSLTMNDDSHQVQGLFLSEQGNKMQLVSLGASRSGWDFGLWTDIAYWQQGAVEINLFDVSVPEVPVHDVQIDIDGYLVSSRRIGDKLYIVSRHTPDLDYYWYPWRTVGEENDEKSVDELTVADILPSWSIDGEDQGLLVSSDNCYISIDAAERYPSIITISAIDLTNPDNIESTCITGQVDTIYMNTESLYLTSRIYRDDVVTIQPADPALVDESSYFVFTVIHKFSINDQGATFSASGTVPGELTWRANPLFLMGAIDGNFGIVTTFHGFSGGIDHRLSFLAEDPDEPRALVVVSTLPNAENTSPIGKPGEDIYAARFFGDKIFIVTFRQMDPLYVIDASDVTSPFIAGELEIPGFSEYLHPISEGLLLGIGQDADVRGVIGGVKLGLFDVNDPTTPIELQSIVIGDRGSYSSALSDYHAVTYLSGSADRPHRLAIPVSVYDPAEQGTHRWQWGRWKHTGLHMFEISSAAMNVSPDMYLVGKIVVASNDDVPEEYYYDEGTWGDRAVIQGDAVHYLHGNDLYSKPWGSISTP